MESIDKVRVGIKIEAGIDVEGGIFVIVRLDIGSRSQLVQISSTRLRYTLILWSFLSKRSQLEKDSPCIITNLVVLKTDIINERSFPS